MTEGKQNPTRHRFATVVKKSLFDAAHKNTGFGEGHKCNRIHGHTFQYEVAVKARIDDRTGLSIDFGVVKQAMKDKVDNVLDHHYLNEDVRYFTEHPPSAENIAYFIFREVQDYLNDYFFDEDYLPLVQWVRLDETPTSSVIVTKEDF